MKQLYILFIQSIKHTIKSKSFLIGVPIFLVIMIFYLFIVPLIIPGSTGIVQYYSNASWFSNVLPVLFVILIIVGWVIGSSNANDGLKVYCLSKSINRSAYLSTKLIVSSILAFSFAILTYFMFVVIHLVLLNHPNNDISFLTKDMNPIAFLFSCMFLTLFSAVLATILPKDIIRNMYNLLISVLAILIYIFVYLNFYNIGSRGEDNNHNYWFSSLSPIIIFGSLTVVMINLGYIIINKKVIYE